MVDSPQSLFPIKQAMTSCPVKRPRVTNSLAPNAQERARASRIARVSLHPSRASARKIGATCHPPQNPSTRFLCPIGNTLTHPSNVFNAFIICDLMILDPSLASFSVEKFLRVEVITNPPATGATKSAIVICSRVTFLRDITFRASCTFNLFFY